MPKHHNNIHQILIIKIPNIKLVFEMSIDYLKISQFIIEIIIFLILMYVGGKILKFVKRKSFRILNIREYFPEPEVYT